MEDCFQINSTAEPSFAELQGTWLISFADLITLLLCAFLMFFSLTWNNRKPDGTQIAPKDIKGQEVNALERRIKLRFLEEEVELASGKLIDEALFKVKSVITSEVYRDAFVTVTSCNEKSAADAEQALLSQLIDAGVPAKQLIARFVGSNCGLLRSSRDRNDTTRATIEFERM